MTPCEGHRKNIVTSSPLGKYPIHGREKMNFMNLNHIIKDHIVTIMSIHIIKRILNYKIMNELYNKDKEDTENLK